MSPTLSVCMATGDPGPRVAAILEPLRPVADEIVVAADSRIDSETLRYYGQFADRLLRFEFAHPIERVFPWLHAQCACDWILRVDGDEVLSPALVARLRELTARQDVVQYHVPTRWLFPDPEHWLQEWPWSPDYHNRLVRNDGLLFVPGLSHTCNKPELPACYLEEPIYHLFTALATHAERKAKLDGYRGIDAAYREPAGERYLETYYLPEIHARSQPARVPEPDRTAIAAVLKARPAQPLAPGEVPLASRAAVDRHWPARILGEGAYRASITIAERYRWLYAAQHRPFHVRVRNDGDETWPGGEDRMPLIRLAYRWLHADSTVAVAEGFRSAFPGPVRPGDEALVPMVVAAPERPGSYVLEIDVVHEFVRWFECATRVEMTIHRPERPGRRRRRLRSSAP